MMTYGEFRKAHNLRRGQKAAMAYMVYRLYSPDLEET